MIQSKPHNRSDALRFSMTVDRTVLEGTLYLPVDAQGVVIFAQLSSCGRLSAQNRIEAWQLHDAGFATLLVNLLNSDEEAYIRPEQALRVDLSFLGHRLLMATNQLSAWPETSGLPLGYFGIGAGTATALMAAAEQPGLVRAVVSWSGYPNLASPYLAAVWAPTLLVVGSADSAGITRNQAALPFLPGESSLALIPGAHDMVGQPEQLAQLAVRWYSRFLN